MGRLFNSNGDHYQSSVLESVRGSGCGNLLQAERQCEWIGVTYKKPNQLHQQHDFGLPIKTTSLQ